MARLSLLLGSLLSSPAIAGNPYPYEGGTSGWGWTIFFGLMYWIITIMRK